jgi:hypothetical protein
MAGGPGNPDPPALGLGNFVRPLLYSAQTADHWIRHNVEETGRSEDNIPALYDHAIAGA